MILSIETILRISAEYLLNTIKNKFCFTNDLIAISVWFDLFLSLYLSIDLILFYSTLKTKHNLFNCNLILVLIHSKNPLFFLSNRLSFCIIEM